MDFKEYTNDKVINSRELFMYIKLIKFNEDEFSHDNYIYTIMFLS